MEARKNTASPSLVIRRVINASRDRVFAAWTNPELMQQWFYPGGGKAIVKIDLRVGGSYSNEMILRAQDKACDVSAASAQEESYIHTGEYLEIDPPERIVFTWNSPLVQNTRVTLDLRDLGESTELTLTHELLETEDLIQKHTGGWEGCLANLSSYLS